MVKGVLVVKEEPVKSNLPVTPGKPPLVAYKGIHVLTLADGNRTYGCADCGVVGGRRDLSQHRSTAHPDEPPTTTEPPAPEPPTPAPARPAPVAARAAAAATRTSARRSTSHSANLMAMTLGEIMSMGTKVGQWETIYTRLRDDRDRWKDKAAQLEAEVRRYQQEARKVRAALARLGP